MIDVQEVLDNPALGILDNPGAEQNIIKILGHWRAHNQPRFIIQYHSPRPASPFHREASGSGLKPAVRPRAGELHIIKHFESAFMKSELEERLREQEIETLVFVGYYTDQCVAVSAKVANNLGFRVIVIADATATTGCQGYEGTRYKATAIQDLALGSLQRDGITIIDTATLLNSF